MSAKKITPPKLKPAKTALMVIDMQNDFTEKGAILEIPNIRKGFAKLKKFVKDCKNKGVSVIYTRHTYTPKGNPIEAFLFPELSREGLRKHTHGWKINGYLRPQQDDIVIDKNRYDAFYKSNLGAVLKEKGVENIIITGTKTEVCVESTARSAMFRDYVVFMPPDLNFTSDKGKHKYALKTFASNFGWVLKSSILLKLLEK